MDQPVAEIVQTGEPNFTSSLVVTRTHYFTTPSVGSRRVACRAMDGILELFVDFALDVSTQI
jgi:hypothetical protein